MSKQALEYKDKGNAEFKKGNHAKAIEYYTYATEMDPSNHVFYTNRSFAYYKIALSQKDEERVNNLNKSLRDAQKSANKNDQWAKAHYRAAMALMALERFPEAMKSMQTAAQIDPAKFEKEIVQVKAAMMKGMSVAEIAKMDGNEAYKVGQIPEAIKHYTTAIKKCTAAQSEMKADILANRAACHRQLYEPDNVIKDCTSALEIKPDHVKALVRRAQAYESVEKYKKSYLDFHQARILNSQTKIAWEGENRIKTAMGKLGMEIPKPM